MSSHSSTVRTLICDEPGCDSSFRGEPGATNVKVRAAAGKRGWLYRPGLPRPSDARDFRPQHGPGRPW